MRISAVLLLVAVPLLALAGFADNFQTNDEFSLGNRVASPEIGLMDNLTSDVLVLEKSAVESTSGPSRASVIGHEPVEVLLRDWQYTLRRPSRFH